MTRCLHCGYSNPPESSFLDLQVPVKGCPSLQTALQRSLEPSFLSDDNQYACSRCGCKRDAVRFQELRRMPPLLTIGFERFAFDLQTLERRKASDSVSVRSLRPRRGACFAARHWDSRRSGQLLLEQAARAHPALAAPMSPPAARAPRRFQMCWTCAPLQRRPQRCQAARLRRATLRAAPLSRRRALALRRQTARLTRAFGSNGPSCGSATVRLQQPQSRIPPPRLVALGQLRTTCRPLVRSTTQCTSSSP